MIVQTFENKKIFEDQLARQNNIIESQIKFLETISTWLWEFHALIAKVAYYQIHESGSGNNNTDQAKSAVEEYEELFWELVIQNIRLK